jgi:hypothetical protein
MCPENSHTIGVVSRSPLLALAGIVVLAATACGDGIKRKGLPARNDPAAAKRLLVCARRSGLDMSRFGPLLNVQSHVGERLTGTIVFYRDARVARKAVRQSMEKDHDPAWAVGSAVYYTTRTPSVDKRVRRCLAGVS